MYGFIESDLRKRGYTEISLGVEPAAVRNLEIYFHLGFREYIKTLMECEQSKDSSSKKEEVIVFYKKKIK